MKKRSRTQLLAEIDALKAQLGTPEEPPANPLKAEVAELKAQVFVLTYLHAELVQEAGYAVAVLTWLHEERGHFLQQFIESEQRLITRARQVKAAKTQAANAALGVPLP